MLRSIGVLLLSLCLAWSRAQAAGADDTLLVFGDSLSAGYGLAPDQGWASLLQPRLASRGYGQRVVNASVSGETTSGGRSRLPRALDQHHPAIVVLELGANDGLRGLPLATASANLGAMIDVIKASKAQVLLVGVELPPNYGPAYTSAFRSMYADLARQHHVALVPFLMEGVALDPRLMQADGLHPNAAGQPRLLDTVWKALLPLLGRPAKIAT
jgi:acyl-CoA thioesterase-1